MPVSLLDVTTAPLLSGQDRFPPHFDLFSLGNNVENLGQMWRESFICFAKQAFFQSFLFLEFFHKDKSKPIDLISSDSVSYYSNASKIEQIYKSMKLCLTINIQIAFRTISNLIFGL